VCVPLKDEGISRVSIRFLKLNRTHFGSFLKSEKTSVYIEIIFNPMTHPKKGIPLANEN